MSSVERVKHYSSLANELYEGTDPPPNWPERGHVTFDNVSLRYAKDLKAVVEGVNVELHPGEKVGHFVFVCALCQESTSNLRELIMQILCCLYCQIYYAQFRGAFQSHAKPNYTEDVN